MHFLASDIVCFWNMTDLDCNYSCSEISYLFCTSKNAYFVVLIQYVIITLHLLNRRKKVARIG